jgi:hypothetical protein
MYRAAIVAASVIGGLLVGGGISPGVSTMAETRYGVDYASGNEVICWPAGQGGSITTLAQVDCCPVQLT